MSSTLAKAEAGLRSRGQSKAGSRPPFELIVFDMDGVLVDVRRSFHKTVLETVRFFTGRRVSYAELHGWKNRGGFNDDWKLSTAWIRDLGGNFEYREVKRKFVEIYWGLGGEPGNVLQEKWLVTRPVLKRLALQAELAIFTGRVRKELDYTLDRCGVREFFRRTITVEDVGNPKPHPEGLFKLIGRSDPRSAVYLGDNVDDALAARGAGVPFIGVLPPATERARERAALLRATGAYAVLREINDLPRWLAARPQVVQRKP